MVAKALVLAGALTLATAQAVASTCQGWFDAALKDESDTASLVKLAVGHATANGCAPWDVRLSYRFLELGEARGLNVVGSLISHFKRHPESSATAYLLASAMRERFTLPTFDFKRDDLNPVEAVLAITDDHGRAIADDEWREFKQPPFGITKDQLLDLVSKSNPKDYGSVRYSVLGLMAYSAQRGYLPAMYDIAHYYLKNERLEGADDSAKGWLKQAMLFGHRSAGIVYASRYESPERACYFYVVAGASHVCDPSVSTDGSPPPDAKDFQKALTSGSSYTARPSPYKGRDFKWWY